MTRLSLSLFWLVSAVAYIRGRATNGDLPLEELDILEYLTAEAEEVQRSEGRVERTRRERVHSKIVSRVLATRSE